MLLIAPKAVNLEPRFSLESIAFAQNSTTVVLFLNNKWLAHAVGGCISTEVSQPRRQAAIYSRKSGTDHASNFMHSRCKPHGG